MNQITVRTAGPGDADILATFNERMAFETEDKKLDPVLVRRGVRHLLEQPQFGFYLVAEVGGRVVGCLMVTYEWSDWRDALFWWVQSVYVEEDSRGRGIYRTLYAELKRRAADGGGVCGFRLYVERENERAQSVYKKLGMNDARYLVFEETVE